MLSGTWSCSTSSAWAALRDGDSEESSEGVAECQSFGQGLEQGKADLGTSGIELEWENCWV